MPNINQLLDVTRSLKMDYGDKFFNSLTLQLHKLIESDYTFIARIDTRNRVSHTVSFASHAGIQDNFEYALEHTPCFDVSHDTICVYPTNVCSLYPKDQLLIDMKIKGYIGIPLHASSGHVVGLIVGLFEREIQSPNVVRDAFLFFEGRISAELERTEMMQELETKVKERTKELEATLASLEATQKQMIDQEKQASLGRLVAGVAHEINTPLGVSILAQTTLGSAAKELKELAISEKLTKSKLIKYCEDIEEASAILNFNLNRASELVCNFKQISNDQINNEVTSIDLHSWLPKVITSLTPLAKQKNVRLSLSSLNVSSNLTTYPAKLYQVINNIVANAIKHAFDDDQKNNNKSCVINCVSDSPNSIQIVITDNGSGIDEQTLSRIYEPFFTTRRGQGGTGLGMSIVYSNVTGPLEGSVSVSSTVNKGTSVTLTLPLIVSDKAIEKPH